MMNIRGDCRNCGNGTPNNKVAPAFAFTYPREGVTVVCLDCGSNQLNLAEVPDTDWFAASVQITPRPPSPPAAAPIRTSQPLGSYLAEEEAYRAPELRHGARIEYPRMVILQELIY